jgi:hypothetical protein
LQARAAPPTTRVGSGIGARAHRQPLTLTVTGTSHVPCKFYRQGACQAGKACPFLHSDEPVTERAPCKYFTKACRLPTASLSSTAHALTANDRVTASSATSAPSPIFCRTAMSSTPTWAEATSAALIFTIRNRP